MSIETELQARSESKCELCSATENLGVYEVPASPSDSANECVYICQTCSEKIENPDKVDIHHWHCLNDSMWSQVPAVQVMAWRMLKRLSAESWVQDLLDMLYLDDDNLAWAQASVAESDEDAVKHIDSNGGRHRYFD